MECGLVCYNCMFLLYILGKLNRSSENLSYIKKNIKKSSIVLIPYVVLAVAIGAFVVLITAGIFIYVSRQKRKVSTANVQMYQDIFVQVQCE